MNINGITFNPQKIAQGLYDMMDENMRNCLKFGMLPEVLFAPLRKILAEKYDEAAGFKKTDIQESFTKLAEIIGEDWKNEMLDGYQVMKAKTLRAIEHEVALAMYRVAPMVV